MKLSHKLQHAILINEFTTFKIGFHLANLIMWSFYQILLFRQTGDLSVIILEYLIYYIAIWCAFVIGTVLLDSTGYLFSMRFMYSLSLIPIVAVLLWIDSLQNYYEIIAIMRGVPVGLYWVIHHSFYLKELHGTERSVYINVQKSVEQILSIVVPISIGSIIAFDDSYTLVFLLGGALYTALFFVPWKYNKVPRSKVTLQEIVRITKMKGFGQYSLFTMIDQAVHGLFVAVFAIVPFLFIGDEFGVGSLMSFIAFIAAISAYFERYQSFKFRYELGLIGYVVRSVMNVVLAFSWILPVLVIRNIIVVLTSSTSDTVQEDLQNKNKELFLRDFKNESAAELNIVLETLFAIGRILSLIPIYILLTNSTNPEVVFQWIVGVFAFYKVFTLMAYKHLNEKLKI